MCKMYYSEKSREKVIHFGNCGVIGRIKKANLRKFSNIEESMSEGYRFCKCCSLTAKKYKKEEKEIKRLRKELQCTYELKNGILNIHSRHDDWKIISYGLEQKMFLYHKNKDKNRKDDIPSIIPDYHKQSYHSNSITGFLKYIGTHDKYRDKHPYIAISWEKSAAAEYFKTQNIRYSLTGYKKQYPKIAGNKKIQKKQKQARDRDRRKEIKRVYNLIDNLTYTTQPQLTYLSA